ncbi:MAG TPA: PIN domain-containing protein [Gammaproteobacteria bacterium]|nr:PIN domain-containing protein [Gammaproteobacteria bacterium]
MSTNYVLDASVVIKWFIPEIYWEQASLLQHYSESYLHTPDFAQLECSSILSKKVRRNELKLDEANDIQVLLLNMPVQMHPWQDLLLAAGQVAHETYRSVYDCLYLVLAKQINGQMVTADKKLYSALEKSKKWGPYLCWIEEIA